MQKEIPAFPITFTATSINLARFIDGRGAARTEYAVPPINRPFHPTSVYAIMPHMWFAVGLIFVLGVGNFALHRAVLESGHKLISQMPGFASLLGKRLTLVAEFLVLLAAMALAANGWTGLAFAYLAYSALNAIAGWLILTGRI